MSKKTAAPKKDKKPAAPAAPKVKRQAQTRLPLLLETAFAVTKLAVLTSAPLVFALSLQAGADLTMAAIRAGTTVLVLGLLLWSANWVLARSALEVIRMQLKEAAERQAPTTTVELEA